MEHRTLDEIRPVAQVIPFGAASSKMSRRQRLERWATVLERYEGRLTPLIRIEYLPERERAPRHARAMDALTSRLLSRSYRGGPVPSQKATASANSCDNDFDLYAAEPAGEWPLSDRAASDNAPAPIEQRMATCSKRRPQRQLRAHCFSHAQTAPRWGCGEALPTGQRQCLQEHALSQA